MIPHYESAPPGLDLRIRQIQAATPNPQGDYVLYWMQAQRRLSNNLALYTAIDRANDLGLPVVVYEGLRPDYPEANARIHTFAVEGMRENAETAAARGLKYLAYVAQKGSVDREALGRLAARAALVVTDEYPAFIFESQTRGLARRIGCPLLTVDNATIIPMRAFAKREFAARTIRPKIAKLLPHFLAPWAECEARVDASGLCLDEFVPTDPTAQSVEQIVAGSGVDPGVRPSLVYRGGRQHGLARLQYFVDHLLDDYETARNDAGSEGTSRLSAYLHFGFVSPLEVALAVRQSGARASSVDAFLEELIVRRELSFNFTFFEPDYTSVESLPNWARSTLEKHADDPRLDVSVDQIEAGQTYDEVWNVAQRELRATGEIHNHPRMLWGKKVLEWCRTPQEAVDLMIRLHYRYALDGRSPLTYTSILWILGLHDRAWGPERPIFGTVRYMSSDAFRRKHDFEAYKARVEQREAEALRLG